MPESGKNQSFKINDAQRTRLEEYCRNRGWEFGAAPYAHWKVKGDKLSIVAYQSGALTIQGKNAPDFIQFVLEPDILGEFHFNTPDENLIQDDYQFHGGIDESGKGDFFGPLVIAGACVDKKQAVELINLGVKDSKLIKSTKKIYTAAAGIRAVIPQKYAVVTIGPEAYNRLYSSMGNLNRLLAWGHARVIENLLELAPECPRMLSDKFADESLIKRALMQKGKTIQLDQQVRAESDVAVAAASILAREGFLKNMEKLSRIAECELPRGGGHNATECAKVIKEKHGIDFLGKVAKLHFKNYSVVAGNTNGEADL